MTALPADTDITSPAFKADPFPFYARLRETSPVHRVRLPGGQHAWLITRYADATRALRDPLLLKDKRSVGARGMVRLPGALGFLSALERNMLDVDGADHARLRTLVHQVFTPGRVEQMRSRVEGITAALLDRAGQRDHFDLIADFALPLPVTVISEVLGVAEGDREKFQRYSRVITSLAATHSPLRALPGLLAFFALVRRMIGQKRRAPQDDLLSDLIRAETEGARLSEDELLAMVFLLLIAGHETTVNLIGNGTLALLRHPAQAEQLRARPELIKPALEELLRHSGPLETATERYAAQDLSYGSAIIPRGALVFVVLASANRDPAQFAQPDELDLTRSDNRHLSFGLGVHYCLGAPLARIEGQIALLRLLQRFPALRLHLQPEQLQWRAGTVLRGLEALPLSKR